ncbi:MAG: hypothetical protein H6Q70_662 [Firmicutes bacterium]|nr:hypothetical protein [Bacillota bacterium]
MNIAGKPFENKGRKTMGLRIILVYDCQVAFTIYLKCNLAIFLLLSIQLVANEGMNLIVDYAY